MLVTSNHSSAGRSRGCAVPSLAPLVLLAQWGAAPLRQSKYGTGWQGGCRLSLLHPPVAADPAPPSPGMGGGMLQARAAPAARGAACRSVLHLCGAQHLCARPKLTLMGL